MRRRLRDLGYAVGRLSPGPRNHIVDVTGVQVGHATLTEGDSIRTGVTAVLAHGGNPYAEKVLAGCQVMNGYGKAAGLSQLEELGTLESPILLTSTVSVGPVWEGGLRWLLDLNPEAAVDRDTMNVVVGECFDGWLSDCRGLHVRPGHAQAAIAAAGQDEVAEGAVGAGTGTTCFGFKSGVGGASRLAGEATTLGCLVVTNYGGRRDAHLLLGAAHEAAEVAESPAQGGSAIVVLATDAPLSERQLRRLAARGGLGLGRAGSFAANASGEYVFAFSTAHRVDHRSDEPHDSFHFLRDDSPSLRELFEAAVEVTAEAVWNSLCSADAVEGRDGHRAEALPYELLASAPGLRRTEARDPAQTHRRDPRPAPARHDG
jgi:D-aminopeptidase